MLMGKPAGKPWLKLLAQVRTHIQIRSARSAAQPLQHAANGKIDVQRLHIDGNIAERLKTIQPHVRSHTMRRRNVDFAVGGVLKWLCGGAGTSYLYVRPDLGKKLQPGFTGWFAHEHPFEFEIGASKYGEAPFRFMQGTTNVPGFYTAMPGLKIIREAGVAR